MVQLRQAWASWLGRAALGLGCQTYPSWGWQKTQPTQDWLQTAGRTWEALEILPGGSCSSGYFTSLQEVVLRGSRSLLWVHTWVAEVTCQGGRNRNSVPALLRVWLWCMPWVLVLFPESTQLPVGKGRDLAQSPGRGFLPFPSVIKLGTPR